MSNIENLKNVVDKHTSAVWKSNKNHNATTFNNHEVVRISADIMARVQAKNGVTARNIEAKRYIVDLINADLELSLKSKDLTAPLVLEVEKALSVAVAPMVAVADITDEFKTWSAKIQSALNSAKKFPTSKQLKAKINALNSVSDDTKKQLIAHFIKLEVAPVVEEIAF